MVDALLWATRRPHRFRNRRCAAWGMGPWQWSPCTAANPWAPPEEIFQALLETARRLPNLRWVYPVHPNPAVGVPARRILRHPRILLTPPLDYLDFVHLMRQSRFIVTDSGGIQEEAPSLGKPVVVAREKTERAETLGRGSILAGTARPALVRAISAVPRRRCPRMPPTPSATARPRNGSRWPCNAGLALVRLLPCGCGRETPSPDRLMAQGGLQHSGLRYG